MSPLDWSWAALSVALLVVGGAIPGIHIGVALERRRARQRPLRDVAPTMVLPPIPPAPTVHQMRSYIGPTCRAERGRP